MLRLHAIKNWLKSSGWKSSFRAILIRIRTTKVVGKLIPTKRQSDLIRINLSGSEQRWHSNSSSKLKTRQTNIWWGEI